jgi:hypothetical protein
MLSSYRFKFNIYKCLIGSVEEALVSNSMTGFISLTSKIETVHKEHYLDTVGVCGFRQF